MTITQVVSYIRRYLTGHMFGDLELTSLLKKKPNIVILLKYTRKCQLLHQYIPGKVQKHHGLECIQILQGHLWGKCFRYFLILILNGLKHVPCQISKLLQHYDTLEFPFKIMGCLLFLWLIMVLLVLVTGLNYLQLRMVLNTS